MTGKILETTHVSYETYERMKNNRLWVRVLILLYWEMNGLLSPDEKLVRYCQEIYKEYERAKKAQYDTDHHA